MTVDASQTAPVSRRTWWLRILGGIALFLLALVLLVVFFPWDLLRGPVNRYVSEKTGRTFEITRRLDVKLGRTTTFIADGIEFANPSWATDPYLIKAERAEVDVRLWPLIKRVVVLPRVMLEKPQLGLQMEPDGRRTWTLSPSDSDGSTTPEVGQLVVDEGSVRFIARDKGADIRVNFGIDPAATGSAETSMPLSYQAKGTWSRQPFTAEGRTGSVLQLSSGEQTAPFPLEVKAQAGRTRLTATGTVGSLKEMEGIDAQVRMQGHNLAELYELLGIALPDTPPYALKAHLKKNGAVWNIGQIDGTLGRSDLSGQLRYDASGQKGLLAGEVQSARLDFNDLGPIIGLAPKPGQGGAKTAAGTAPPVTASDARRRTRSGGKVLPTTKLDLEKLNAMNADVRYSAKRIEHVEELPLESGSVHVKLNDGLLVLDPLALGVAGGRIAGSIRVDGSQAVPDVATRLEARNLRLEKLFPTVERTRQSFGNVTLRVNLQARGDSVATLLGRASGDVGLLMGRGQFSNILLEFAGLDGGEAIKFFLRGDRNVQLRCGAAAFDVKNGLMTSTGIVMDTSDTVINGEGRINLADESLYVVLKPLPKDKSILSLRSPLIIQGTLGAPSAFPDKGALAGRAALAVALGAINPFLALAATIETGPGEDADCQKLLAQTPAPQPKAR